MESLDFPSCCTVRILRGFGDVIEADKLITHSSSKEQIRRELQEYCRSSKKVYAMLVVVTNNKQREANAVLLEEGFKHSKWATKDKHPNTKVRLWWKCLNN